MELSLVIPLLNESESLEELCNWIIKELQKAESPLNYEIIFIDDGSTDNSWEIISGLKKVHPKKVRGIRFLKNFGKSQAIHAGFKACTGAVVITMDADLQDHPSEILPLYKLITQKDYDLVSGWKKIRYDSVLLKNLPSKLFNAAARWTSGVKLHDFNCGIKAYKQIVVKSINVRGEMHRYIPVLAKNQGFYKITEKVVQHQARKYGTTKFGIERFINGFLDLITIWFLSKFGKRPMHFFGLLGVLVFFIGFCFSSYLGIEKLYLNPQSRLITQRPEFYIALTCIVLGIQFFLAGFIGEIYLRNKPEENLDYHIWEEI